MDINQIKEKLIKRLDDIRYLKLSALNYIMKISSDIRFQTCSQEYLKKELDEVFDSGDLSESEKEFLDNKINENAEKTSKIVNEGKIIKTVYIDQVKTLSIEIQELEKLISNYTYNDYLIYRRKSIERFQKLLNYEREGFEIEREVSVKDRITIDYLMDKMLNTEEENKKIISTKTSANNNNKYEYILGRYIRIYRLFLLLKKMDEIVVGENLKLLVDGIENVPCDFELQAYKISNSEKIISLLDSVIPKLKKYIESEYDDDMKEQLPNLDQVNDKLAFLINEKMDFLEQHFCT